MTLRALILDVDGTLADTEEAHRCAFNRAFAQHGLDWSWSRPKYAALLETTGGKERLRVFANELPLPPEARRTLIERIPAIHRTKTEIYSTLVGEGAVTLRDGVERLLDEAASANVQVAIASTTTLENIETLLRKTLGRYSPHRFAVIGAGDQVRRKKPAPEIYRFVLRELAQPACACVAIEDSAHGLTAAKAAGLYTVVTPSYWTRDEDFSEADLVLPSLGSRERPLPPRAAQSIGAQFLTLEALAALFEARSTAPNGAAGAASQRPEYESTRADGRQTQT
ncbi:MAG TPA: HAD-IA family hydrolase [Steroidobacteraceae bacterium]|nr:HAD-IA family hydrolase [Steroidobacteraceae bacterium]